MANKDAYLIPAFSVSNRIARFVWGIVYAALFRPSPRPFHRWRVFLLRCFGARIGSGCAVYPKSEVWAPWNLVCEDVVAVADGAIIYNPSQITLGSHCIVSQQAYLCGATHDHEDPNFPLISAPITLEAYSWVCARATVQPGITLGKGAILGLGAVATKDLEPWSIYGGIPARKLKNRKHEGFDGL
ncbi:MAG: putative colanic acid biosynthesis acetyltransferase [Geobacteraceae bacterium]|nr:putative colanic acid biosynthesis acetyltransferase [Geobacteraceae bacterium]